LTTQQNAGDLPAIPAAARLSTGHADRIVASKS
jgi:hypothetical protein